MYLVYIHKINNKIMKRITGKKQKYTKKYVKNKRNKTKKLAEKYIRKNGYLFLGGNKIHKIKYKDGSTYTGEVDEFYLPKGKGMMEYPNGDIYKGDWNDNKKNGKGEMQYKNGNKYKGTWKNDMKYGEGMMKYFNGQSYNGLWKNDLYDDIFNGETMLSFEKNGEEFAGPEFDIDCQDVDDEEYEVTINYKDGSKFEGTITCIDGELIANGVMTYSNGNIYGGNFLRGMKNEFGSMFYSNGDVYEGEWQDDLKNGEGEMKYANGDIYNGEWKYDLKNGQGEMKYSNQDIYSGEWEGDLKQGIGKMNYANGNKYIGQWNDDIKYGKGEIKYENGDIYKGQFENDMKHGKGEMTYNNGDIYIGQWKNDFKNGYGKLIYKNGEIYNGYWINDKKIISQKPLEIKSAQHVTQLNGTCWAHSISRSITRTFLLLNLINGEDSDDIYTVLYCYLTNFSTKKCNEGENTFSIFSEFVEKLKENPEKIFEFEFKNLKCEFLLGDCKIDSNYRNEKILNWNENKKNKFLEIFNKIKSSLDFKSDEYKFDYSQENLPSLKIKLALKKRIQPVISNNKIKHAFILRSWGKEYEIESQNIAKTKNRFCYKNTWENDKNTCIDDIKEVIKLVDSSIELNTKSYITNYVKTIVSIDNKQMGNINQFVGELFYKKLYENNKYINIVMFYWLDFDLNKLKKIDPEFQLKVIERIRKFYKII